mmetsp:Transcript_31329/g.67536  ORF Transcript_31329/g.67536 Transcript_31329/m.67536 type:complete len:308 (-) Transcript_31329:176-1099(-)
MAPAPHRQQGPLHRRRGERRADDPASRCRRGHRWQRRPASEQQLRLQHREVQVPGEAFARARANDPVPEREPHQVFFLQEHRDQCHVPLLPVRLGLLRPSIHRQFDPEFLQHGVHGHSDSHLCPDGFAHGEPGNVEEVPQNLQHLQQLDCDHLLEGADQSFCRRGHLLLHPLLRRLHERRKQFGRPFRRRENFLHRASGRGHAGGAHHLEARDHSLRGLRPLLLADHVPFLLPLRVLHAGFWRAGPTTSGHVHANLFLCGCLAPNRGRHRLEHRHPIHGEGPEGDLLSRRRDDPLGEGGLQAQGRTH